VTGDEIITLLQERFGAEAVTRDELGKDPAVVVPVDSLLGVLELLRDDAGLQMDSLLCVTGLDLMGLAGHEEPRLRSAYHLYSIALKHGIILMTDVDRDRPEVPTASGLWASAIWLEREAYDLLGIIYVGHPALTRILLPAEFEGFPLRKDWVEPSHVMGISTTRETPLDLLKAFHTELGGELPEGFSQDGGAS
jgi:NADH-quinone oxidoreductase subunit C